MDTQMENVGGLRVLLIEDSDTDAYVVERALHKHMKNAHYKRAKSFREGEEILEKGNTDVVLLDLGLPDTTGPADTYAHAKKWTSVVPIVIMTNLKDHDFARTMVQEGAADFLNKDAIGKDLKLIQNAIDFSVERHSTYQRLMSEKDKAVKDSKEKDAVLSCFMGGYSVTNSGK